MFATDHRILQTPQILWRMPSAIRLHKFLQDSSLIRLMTSCFKAVRRVTSFDSVLPGIGLSPTLPNFPDGQCIALWPNCIGALQGRDLPPVIYTAGKSEAPTFLPLFGALVPRETPCLTASVATSCFSRAPPPPPRKVKYTCAHVQLPRSSAHWWAC